MFYDGKLHDATEEKVMSEAKGTRFNLVLMDGDEEVYAELQRHLNAATLSEAHRRGARLLNELFRRTGGKITLLIEEEDSDTHKKKRREVEFVVR